MAAIEFTLNGKSQTVDAPGDMPLLWVLRDTLGLTGTKFGCGMALCGACTVHVNGQPLRSCVTPISERRRPARHHHRGPFAGPQPPGPAGLDRGGRAAVRLLPVRPDHDRRRAAGQNGAAHRRRYRRSHAATTSAAAAPIRPSAAPSTWPRNTAHMRAGEATDERHSAIQPPQFPAHRRRRRRRPVGRLPPAGRGRTAASRKLNAWVHVGTDDTVTLFIHKAEMGQGTVTSLSMLLAEELECDWKQDPHRIPRRRPRLRPHTRAWWAARASALRGCPLRQAGAAAREMLVEAAAQTVGCRPAAHAAPKTAPCVNTAIERPADLRQPGRRRREAPAARRRARSRTPRQFHLIGKPHKRLDTPDKT